MPITRSPARIGAVVAIILVGASLAGCADLRQLGMTHEQVDYPSWADAPTSGGPASVPPAFVPHDASNLYLRTSLVGKGATITYTSPESVEASKCVAGVLTGKPRLDSNWWPERTTPTDGMVCPHGWQIFQLDGVTYGWRDE